jgi:hypothetical protein
MARKAASTMSGFGSAQGRWCLDCRRLLDIGNEPEVYLVDDRLWKRAGLTPWDGLCMMHLSERLGRPLRRADFVHAQLPYPGPSPFLEAAFQREQKRYLEAETAANESR